MYGKYSTCHGRLHVLLWKEPMTIIVSITLKHYTTPHPSGLNVSSELLCDDLDLGKGSSVECFCLWFSTDATLSPS